MFRRFLPATNRRRTLEPQRPESLFDMMENFWRNSVDFPIFRDVDFPPVNLSEDEKEILVEAELPGMEAKDIDISVQNNNLILQGEKKFEDEEKKDNYHRIEQSYGSFYRTVLLPSEVDEDKIKAKYKNGILEIKMPKAESARGRKIEIEQ